MKLVTCTHCGRHVRPTEACPFCRRGTSLGVLALSLALAACGSSPPTQDPPEPPQARDAAVEDPPLDEPDEPQAQDPKEDEEDNAPVALYGGPPDMLDR